MGVAVGVAQLQLQRCSSRVWLIEPQRKLAAPQKDSLGVWVSRNVQNCESSLCGLAVHGRKYSNSSIARHQRAFAVVTV